MKLYFIAIFPDEDLRERIGNFKKEIKEKYRSKHSLKLPAHITLQPPFKASEEEEQDLLKALESFAKEQEQFSVVLNGFDSFPPRVIFVKVQNPQSVVRFHNQLQKELRGIIAPEYIDSSPIHPHITIATRDLSKKAYKSAWNEYKDQEFETSFDVHSIVLLKHDGKTWQDCRELSFGK